MKYYHILLAAALMLVVGCQEKSSPETPVTPPEPVEVANGFFVTPYGLGDKTGEDWDNAWSYEQFKDSIRVKTNGEKYDGKTFYFAGGDYSVSFRTDINFQYEDPINLTIKGGYDPYSSGKDLSKRDLVKYPTTISRPSGRILQLMNFIEVTIDGIVFADGSTGYGVEGVIFVTLNSGIEGDTRGYVTLKNCEFRNNETESTKGGSAIWNVYPSILRLDNVLFTKNSGANYGAAVRNDRGTIFMNGCKFTGNTLTGTGDVYGNAFAGSGPMCMYNTLIGKNSGGLSAVYLLQSGGALLIANSTIIDDNASAVAKNAANKESVIVNSILLSGSESEPALSILSTSADFTSKGHNLIGKITRAEETQFTVLDTDVTDCTLSGLGMSWRGDNYIWNGVVEGFTRATLDEVKAAMAEFKHSYDETIGQQFVDWLESIDAFDTDCFGNTRPAGSFWPGAYQGAN